MALYIPSLSHSMAVSHSISLAYPIVWLGLWAPTPCGPGMYLRKIYGLQMIETLQVEILPFHHSCIA